GTISINETVEKMDLAKTTLREHLLQMERDGNIERQYERLGPGRPSLLYKLTPKGNNLFPSYEASLLRELVEYLKSRGDRETVEMFFEQFWNERYEKVSKKMVKVIQRTEKFEEEGVCHL